MGKGRKSNTFGIMRTGGKAPPKMKPRDIEEPWENYIAEALRNKNDFASKTKSEVKHKYNTRLKEKKNNKNNSIEDSL